MIFRYVLSGNVEHLSGESEQLFVLYVLANRICYNGNMSIARIQRFGIGDLRGSDKTDFRGKAFYTSKKERTARPILLCKMNPFLPVNRDLWRSVVESVLFILKSCTHMVEVPHSIIQSTNKQSQSSWAFLHVMNYIGKD